MDGAAEKPVRQLEFDLANDRVAEYNWITPDQYNDMHNALTNGIAGLTGDSSQIRAGRRRHAKAGEAHHGFTRLPGRRSHHRVVRRERGRWRAGR